MDWYPTLLDICGIQNPVDNLDGKSVLPLIDAHDAKSLHKRLYWQWQKGWAVREGKWKLIANGNHGLGRPKLDKLMLTNLEDERPETHNYADEHPEIVEKLQKYHDAWAEDVFAEYGP